MGAMNWDAIGALGEAIGGAAIIITLIYIAVQIRQNAQFTRASAQQLLSNQINVYHERIVENPERLRVFRSAMVSWDGLSSDDQAVAHLLIGQLVNHFEQAYYLHNTNLVPTPMFETYRGIVLSIIQTPGGAEFWEAVKPLANAEIREYLDAQLALKIDLPPPWPQMLPWYRPSPQ